MSSVNSESSSYILYFSANRVKRIFTAIMSGMELEFKGVVLHIDNIGSLGTKKEMPKGVYFQQLNAWKHSKLESVDDTLATFLDSKKARALYDEMCAAFKEVKHSGGAKKLLAVVSFGHAGTGYPKAKVKEIVADFAPKFAELGISIGACGVIVNLGQQAWSDFLWVEFVDVAEAPDGYDSSFGKALLK